MPELGLRPTTVVGIGAVVLAVGAALFFSRGPGPASTPTSTSGPALPSEQAVVVHVAGAVRRPGLVSLTAPARIADAVNAAGGATSAADLGAINLAGSVEDGDRILVPVVGSDPEATDPGVDLNRAGAAELAELPGIGPVLADRIVAFREEHGPFEAIEDLLDVPGIGEAKLALLRPAVSAP